MVSGLFVPIIGALYWDKSSSVGAIAAMIFGGSTTVGLGLLMESLPAGLDANVFGISVSAVIFVVVSLAFPDQDSQKRTAQNAETMNTITN
jgi:SSS family solute:Na+ symporter